MYAQLSTHELELPRNPKTDAFEITQLKSHILDELLV